MIKIEKPLAFLTAMAVLLSAWCVGVSATVDIDGHWAKETLQRFIDSGYLKGYEDETIRPDNSISRAEFITMVNRIVGFSSSEIIDYSDVVGDEWFVPELEIAKGEGYITGYEDGTIRPNNRITRQEAAIIAARIANLDDDAGSAEVFLDKDSIADWSKAKVGAAVKAEIIKGYPDNTFKPNNEITRAETAVILSRMPNVDLGLTGTPYVINRITTNRGGSSGGSGGNNPPVSPTISAAVINSPTSIIVRLSQAYSGVSTPVFTATINGTEWNCTASKIDNYTYVLTFERVLPSVAELTVDGENIGTLTQTLPASSVYQRVLFANNNEQLDVVSGATKWYSSDPEVVYVSNGTVSANKAGFVVVTATNNNDLMLAYWTIVVLDEDSGTFSKPDDAEYSVTASYIQALNLTFVLIVTDDECTKVTVNGNDASQQQNTKEWRYVLDNEIPIANIVVEIEKEL